MSINKISNAFLALPNCEAWSMQLLKITPVKNSATTYFSRYVSFSPETEINSFIKDISDAYSGAKGKISLFTDIRDYDGSALDKTIYKISASNELISDEYQNFLDAIKNPNVEINPLDVKFDGYLIKGSITIGDKEYPTKLISMQNPITTLNHKYGLVRGTFKEISKKVLSLKNKIDVIILDKTIYMLTLDGEKLFNMERSYKKVSASKIAEIKKLNMVTDFESFSLVASSGQNPRKFVSFNDNHLEKLEDVKQRKKMAKKFNIPITGNKFNTSSPDASDKIVKLLCDRGMVDPFDDTPIEVAGSKKWI